MAALLLLESTGAQADNAAKETIEIDNENLKLDLLLQPKDSKQYTIFRQLSPIRAAFASRIVDLLEAPRLLRFLISIEGDHSDQLFR